MFEDSERLMASHHVQCPWCHEWIELVLTADQGDVFVEDCEVCCRPWTIRVIRDLDGTKRLSVERE